MVRQRIIGSDERGARHRLIKRLLAEREERGESYREVSERSGIPITTLAGWQKRLQERGELNGDRAGSAHRSGKGETVDLIEVGRARVGSWGSALEVVLRSGIVVRVPRQFDADELRRLLETLEPRC